MVTVNMPKGIKPTNITTEEGEQECLAQSSLSELYGKYIYANEDLTSADVISIVDKFISTYQIPSEESDITTLNQLEVQSLTCIIKALNGECVAPAYADFIYSYLAEESDADHSPENFIRTETNFDCQITIYSADSSARLLSQFHQNVQKKYKELKLKNEPTTRVKYHMPMETLEDIHFLLLLLFVQQTTIVKKEGSDERQRFRTKNVN